MQMVAVAAMMVPLWAFVVRAQDAGTDAGVPVVAAPAPAPAPAQSAVVDAGPAEPPPPLVLVPTADGGFVYELHDVMVVRASGTTASQLRAQLPTTQPGRIATLVIDGVPMSNLKSTITEAPPQLRPDGGVVMSRENDLLISFSLERNSADDANRQAWDALLGRHSYVMQVPVYVSISNGVAQVVSTGYQSVQLSVASLTSIQIVGTVAALAIIALLVLLVRSDMLRDGDTGYYSLGRSQMAFWGVIVFVSTVAVLFITRTLERIPLQTLGLLGISGATGLGAMLIGRDDAAKKRVAKVKNPTLLRREMKALLAKGVTLPDEDKPPTPEQERLKALDDHLNRMNFFRDICDDGTGPSFHRVQVVLWTLLLGGVFLFSVGHVMSMPEFPESLLLLMGISNATYLGFKVPEDPDPAPVQPQVQPPPPPPPPPAPPNP